jgi:cobalamin biosynthetic protein CobC
MSVSKTVIASDTDSDATAPEHGGDLGAARALFPGAPEPFIDLSTGINPFAYGMPSLAPEVFARLPDPAATERLSTIAARAYGAPSAAHVVVAPGSQGLLPHVFALPPIRRAMVLSPTYSEHARVAAFVGHRVTEAREVALLKDAGLSIVVNPNNPDGRLLERRLLLDIADQLRDAGGLLVVDEAFMDVGPLGGSLAGDVGGGNIVVLRSFGKFFGLAGLRLGFAIAAPAIVARLRLALGPWAASGPALAAGAVALADQDWIDSMRVRLATAAIHLDALLHEARLRIVGGTSLFRTVQTPAAAELFLRLGKAGILVRRFSERADLLRFGLPGDENAWERLRAALIDADPGASSSSPSSPAIPDRSVANDPQKAP